MGKKNRLKAKKNAVQPSEPSLLNEKITQPVSQGGDEEKIDVTQPVQQDEAVMVITLPEGQYNIHNVPPIYKTKYSTFQENPFPAIVIPWRIFETYQIKDSDALSEDCALTRSIINSHDVVSRKFFKKDMGFVGEGVFLKSGEFIPKGSCLIYPGIYIEKNKIKGIDHYAAALQDNKTWAIANSYAEYLGVTLKLQHTPSPSNAYLQQYSEKYKTVFPDTFSWKAIEHEFLFRYKDKNYMVPMLVLRSVRNLSSESEPLHMTWDYKKTYWKGLNMNPVFFDLHGNILPSTLQLTFNTSGFSDLLLSQSDFERLISEKYIMHEDSRFVASKITIDILKAHGFDLLARKANKLNLGWLVCVSEDDIDDISLSGKNIKDGFLIENDAYLVKNADKYVDQIHAGEFDDCLVSANRACMLCNLPVNFQSEYLQLLLYILEKSALYLHEWEAWFNLTQIRIQYGFVKNEELLDKKCVDDMLRQLHKEQDISTIKACLIGMIPKINGEIYPELVSLTLHKLSRLLPKENWHEKNELRKLSMLIIAYHKKCVGQPKAAMSHSVLFPMSGPSLSLASLSIKADSDNVIRESKETAYRVS